MGHLLALRASGFQIKKESWEFEINCMKLGAHQYQGKVNYLFKEHKDLFTWKVLFEILAFTWV